MTKTRKHRWHLIREHKRGNRANPKGVPGEVICLARGCTAQKYLLPGTGYPGLSRVIGGVACPSD
jgi:hypothetical protein